MSALSRRGGDGLTHRSTGQRSNAARDEDERARILALVREKYSGTIDERFGPTLIARALGQRRRRRRASRHAAPVDEVGVLVEDLSNANLVPLLIRESWHKSLHCHTRNFQTSEGPSIYSGYLEPRVSFPRHR